MLLSKSIKNHIKIWKKIKTKNKNFYSINSLFSYWWIWRKKTSSYPLVIFFVWFLMVEILPDYLTQNIFLQLRNLKFFLKNIKSYKS